MSLRHLPNFLRPLGTIGPCIVNLPDGSSKRYITLPNRLQLDDNEDHCTTIINGRLPPRDPPIVPQIHLEDNGEFELETRDGIFRFKEIDYDNEEYPIRYFNPYQNAFKKSRSKKSKGVKKSKKSKKSKGKKKSKGSKKSN